MADTYDDDHDQAVARDVAQREAWEQLFAAFHVALYGTHVHRADPPDDDWDDKCWSHTGEGPPT